jgi:type 1 glutamine amidotransferase
MHDELNRRSFLKAAAMTAAGAALTPMVQQFAAAAPESDAARKRVLFFTKSSGYQHSVITRPANDPQKLAYAEQILTDLGARNGFDVVCSKDGTIFTPENLAKFDVFAFYTTGDLTKDSDKYATKKGPDGKDVPDPTRLLHKEPGMPPGAKEAFLEAIRGGKGFVGFHAATDTFHSPAHVKSETGLLRNVDEQGRDAFDPYISMIGGEFIIHGKQQNGTLRAIDRAFPGAAALDNANFLEEWYSLKNFATDLHVILAMDCTGMNGGMYQRAPFPQTWARMHGSGRVFYTSMGHREDVWQKPEFLGLVTAALNWTGGKVDADVAPNISQATPGANVQPKDLPTTQKRPASS